MHSQPINPYCNMYVTINIFDIQYIIISLCVVNPKLRRVIRPPTEATLARWSVRPHNSYIRPWRIMKISSKTNLIASNSFYRTSTNYNKCSNIYNLTWHVWSKIQLFSFTYVYPWLSGTISKLTLQRHQETKTVIFAYMNSSSTTWTSLFDII